MKYILALNKIITDELLTLLIIIAIVLCGISEIKRINERLSVIENEIKTIKSVMKIPQTLRIKE